MKKILLMAAMACCLGVTTVNAAENESVQTVQVQEKNNFVGKWKSTVEGTPMGDIEMVMEIVVKKDEEGNVVANKFVMKSEEQGEVTGTLKDDKLIFEMEAEGYEFELTLELVDEDTMKGDIMGMFDFKATRVKEVQE